MAIIDANIVLRYILDDHEELPAKAAEILEHNHVVEGQEIFTFDNKLYKHIQRTSD